MVLQCAMRYVVELIVKRAFPQPYSFLRVTGNAYLEAITSEKVYIIAGSEFGELEGHILVFSRALYGL